MILGLAACAPQSDLPSRYAGPPAAQIDSCWWRTFGDTTLNRLIDVALTRHRNLVATAARVEEARAHLDIVRAYYLPQIGAPANDTDTIQPSLSRELTRCGVQHDTRRAVRAQLAASPRSGQGMRHALAAQVAIAYFELREYEQALEIARSTCRLRKQSAAMIDSLHRLGLSSGVDLAQARSLVHEAEADIPRCKQAAEAVRRSLGMLLGTTLPQPSAAGSGYRLERLARPVEVPECRPTVVGELHRPEPAEHRYEPSTGRPIPEVETLLDTLETDRRQIEHYEHLVAANRVINSLMLALYKSGMADYPDVIDTERDLYASQLQLAHRVARQYIHYVEFCKALGGGF